MHFFDRSITMDVPAAHDKGPSMDSGIHILICVEQTTMTCRQLVRVRIYIQIGEHAMQTLGLCIHIHVCIYTQIYVYIYTVLYHTLTYTHTYSYTYKRP